MCNGLCDRSADCTMLNCFETQAKVELQPKNNVWKIIASRDFGVWAKCFVSWLQ